ncbi:MAG: Zn-ribbon domain-containing OB-fold protein [Myxococcota bacterium]
MSASKAVSDYKGIPLPRPTDLSKPHWDGCRDGVLRVQRCSACGAFVFIPQPICTACQGDHLEWVESSGRGRVYSFTTVHRPPRPAFDTPYVVAIVELEEGWHMLTNIIGCSPESVQVDMPVEVSFERMSEQITLPMFRPA